MKKVLFSLPLVIASTGAFAQNSRSIYDVMYLPKAGTLYGFSTVSAKMGNSESFNQTTRTKTSTNDLTGYAFHQTVGYAVADQLSAAVTMNYTHQELEVDTVGSTKDTFKKNGVSDPTFDFKFRALDSAFLVDVLAGGTIGLQDSKSATATKDGNNFQGGHSAYVGAEFGRKLEKRQYSFKALVNRHLESTDKTSGTKTKTKEHNSYLLQATGLFNITGNTFVKPHASMRFTDRHKDNQGTTYFQKSTFNLGLELQHALSANLLLRLGAIYENNESNRSDDGTSRIEERKDYVATFIAGANYQF